MNDVGIFIYGSIVTLAVLVAMGLLVWGAILDGRYDRERRAERRADEREGERRRSLERTSFGAE